LDLSSVLFMIFPLWSFSPMNVFSFKYCLYGEARGSTNWPEEFIDEVLEYARENPRAKYRTIANHFEISYDQFGNSIRGWLIEAGLKRENIHWRKRPEWEDHKKNRAQIQGIDL